VVGESEEIAQQPVASRKKFLCHLSFPSSIIWGRKPISSWKERVKVTEMFYGLERTKDDHATSQVVSVLNNMVNLSMGKECEE